jgi:hypothetical protein
MFTGDSTSAIGWTCERIEPFGVGDLIGVFDHVACRVDIRIVGLQKFVYGHSAGRSEFDPGIDSQRGSWSDADTEDEQVRIDFGAIGKNRSGG